MSDQEKEYEKRMQCFKELLIKQTESLTLLENIDSRNTVSVKWVELGDDDNDIGGIMNGLNTKIF